MEVLKKQTNKKQKKQGMWMRGKYNTLRNTSRVGSIWTNHDTKQRHSNSYEYLIVEISNDSSFLKKFMSSW